jgi:hypothetical protein
MTYIVKKSLVSESVRTLIPTINRPGTFLGFINNTSTFRNSRNFWTNYGINHHPSYLGRSSIKKLVYNVQKLQLDFTNSENPYSKFKFFIPPGTKSFSIKVLDYYDEKFNPATWSNLNNEFYNKEFIVRFRWGNLPEQINTNQYSLLDSSNTSVTSTTWEDRQVFLPDTTYIDWQSNALASGETVTWVLKSVDTIQKFSSYNTDTTNYPLDDNPDINANPAWSYIGLNGNSFLNGDYIYIEFGSLPHKSLTNYNILGLVCTLECNELEFTRWYNYSWNNNLFIDNDPVPVFPDPRDPFFNPGPPRKI